MTTRVYVPATLALLAELAEGGLPASVERYVAEDESEEAEYDALMAAAAESRSLLAGPGRRVVVVAELADPDGPVPLDRVVAVHADDPDDRSDPDHPREAGEDDDLGWYATQEIPDLLA